MIKFFAVVMLVISVSQCAAKCEETWSVNCSSFEDFYNFVEGDNKMENVIIQSKEKQEIDATILKSFPNIQTIEFVGSVDYINDLTFAAPSYLKRIEFDNCELPIIRKNSFVFNSFDDVFLSIKRSKVNYLEPNCFAKSINLYKLDLEYNNITKININVFNGTLIAKLYLVFNNIKFIEENALNNMTRLHRLNLRGNFLTSFDAKLYLNNVPNLKHLDLSNNNIEFLNKNNFIAFQKLGLLLLDSNKIQWIENNVFNGLPALYALSIANNSLYTLPERSFPYNGLPSLKYLDIANNKLNYLPHQFLLWLPKLERFYLFGNPWQCACYKDIMKALSYTNVTIQCADHYLKGQRPVCVVPRTGNGECDDNISDPTELYKTFMDGLKEYDTLNDCNKNDIFHYSYVLTMG